MRLIVLLFRSTLLCDFDSPYCLSLIMHGIAPLSDDTQDSTQECHIRCSVLAEIASRHKLALNVARADYLDRIARSEDDVAALQDDINQRNTQLVALSSGLEQAVSCADSLGATMKQVQGSLANFEEVSSL